MSIFKESLPSSLKNYPYTLISKIGDSQNTERIMSQKIHSVILGTGHYLPELVVKGSDFLDNEFLDRSGEKIQANNSDIIEKFYGITGIAERRYAPEGILASDLGFFAAEKAIEDAGIDKETLDYIIVAHNFGDVRKSNGRVDTLPTLAAKVKQKLKIENPWCVAYDLPFGCPGWVEGMIQANYYIKSGDAKKVLVIGTETLSRVIDPHDRDSMIYADGAGATIMGATDEETGIMAHLTRSDTLNHALLLRMAESYKKDYGKDIFIKMEGRKLYNYALTHVPPLVKKCIEKAGVELSDIKKVLIHQANEKMDEAMLSRLFKSYGLSEVSEGIMPMIIKNMGNNSVATVPVLLDKIRRGELKDHSIEPGDHIIFASVGAGMNCNAIVYKAT